ncbi:hypothetical protein FCULG_00003072 [Fusarium culmorum]|uniref:Uncharacterized protein n=1 Tax=Fusarium culmorum TaxID=5516 RepID=A0A2T4H6U1_FUSCU|nr:hypothetical protein FCULG_00003072 [Fusarium culmorum]
MPPRSSLTSSFSITDSNNEVVCPFAIKMAQAVARDALPLCFILPTCPASVLELPMLRLPAMYRHVSPLTSHIPQVGKHIPVAQCNGTDLILNA